MPVQGGDTIDVTAVYGFPGTTLFMNVFSIRCIGGTVPAADSDVMADLESYMSTVYGAANTLFNDGVVPVELRGFNDTQNYPMPIQAWTSWGGGTQLGEVAPHGVAALILFRTGQLKVLGRKFIGGLGEASLDNGFLNTGTLTQMGAWSAALLAGHVGAITGITFDYRVRGKFGGEYPPIEGVMRNVPAYQRRRKPGIGI